MKRALSAVLLAALSANAFAYQRDEHYYSARLAYAKKDGGETVALCSQLADEAPELNAIAVYKKLMRHPLDYASWSLRGKGSAAVVGRMIAVQQLLHGLTGGDPKGVRAIAEQLTREFSERARAEKDPEKMRDAYCALGFAFHLYGDSFAHQRLKNPGKMYRTGIGHLFDATRPDHPLCTADRFDLWKVFLSGAHGLTAEASTQALDPMFDMAAQCRLGARSGNDYAREELTKAEAAVLRQRGLEGKPLARNLKELPCQAVADAAGPGAPNCARAWALYRGAASAAFDAYDAAHPSSPAREKRWDWFDGSPFEELR